MPKSRRLRRTKRMRGGNEEDMAILNRASEQEVVTVEQPPVEQPTVEQPPVEQPPVEQPTVEQPPVEQPPVEQPPVEQPTVEQPTIEPSPAIPQIKKTVGEHVKNVTRKVTKWFKGLLGIDEQMGGKRRNRKHRKTMKKMRKNKHH
jgi:hypothetical protein